MSWQGPKVDGVTQTLINRFLQCPYCFYLYAIKNLRVEEELSDNLIWGDTFHVGLEHLLRTRDYDHAEEIMVQHLFDKYSRPNFEFTLRKMLALYTIKDHMAGKWISEEIIDQYVGPYRFRGKRDGINREHHQYGQLLAEHKCKGYIDPVQTRDELCQDLQCNLYMYLDGTEWVAYDLIRIPDVQKYGPSRGKKGYEDWAECIFRGPIGSYGGNYPIIMHTNKWVHQEAHFLPREEQEEYWKYTILPIVARMQEWFEYVTEPEFDYTNPEHYNSKFYRVPVRHFDGRKTEKFKCDYYPLLIGEVEEYELEPVTLFSELTV